MNKKAYGFTLIELLIVIIVIAILATITVVAYNGIQKRATTQLYNSSAGAIQKSLDSRKVTDKQGLINAVSTYGVGGLLTMCVAKTADLPARDGFMQGECAKDDMTTSVVANDAAFDAVFGVGPSPYRSKVFQPLTYSFEVTYHVRSPYIRIFDDGGYILQWLTPDLTGCTNTGPGVVAGYYNSAKRVIEEGVPIADSGLPTSLTYEQVQTIYDTLKNLPNSCVVVAP